MDGNVQTTSRARTTMVQSSEKGRVIVMPEQRTDLVILFISHGAGFPNGFAPTQRMRLVAKALTESGVRVRVLLTRVSERPPAVANTRIEGEWRTIPFKYSTGTTLRSERFLVRRWTELIGVIGGVASIVSGWRTGEFDCVYLWMSDDERVPFRMFRGLCALLGMPVVCELCEPSRAVWEGAPLSDGAGRRDSLLTHADGFVAISSGLEAWVRTRKDGERPAILRVPVLVDTDEMEPSFARAARNDVFYAAAPGYVDEIEFVLDVIEMAREQRADLRIRFSGWEIAEVPRSGLQDRLRAHVASGSAIVEGVLPRERLLESYRECAVLLLPMKDEPRSLARFPTKLGEYLASGRPIVATAIGELDELLSDGKNAFLAEPGSVRSFAGALLRALGDPEHAIAVGRGGRALAEQVLDYRATGEWFHQPTLEVGSDVIGHQLLQLRQEVPLAAHPLDEGLGRQGSTRLGAAGAAEPSPSWDSRSSAPPAAASPSATCSKDGRVTGLPRRWFLTGISRSTFATTTTRWAPVRSRGLGLFRSCGALRPPLRRRTSPGPRPERRPLRRWGRGRASPNEPSGGDSMHWAPKTRCGACTCRTVCATG